MAKYVKDYELMKAQFQEAQIQQIPLEENGWANELACLASSLIEWTSRETLHLELDTSLAIQSVDESTKEREEATLDWRTELKAYRRNGIVLTDPKVIFPLIRRVKHFIVLEGVLFKRSFGRLVLQCLGVEEVKGFPKEIHEGCYDNHLGGRALARKVILTNYFWPTLNQDATQMVKICRVCQLHSNRSGWPVELMKAVVTSYPFNQWGMDLVNPLPLAP